MVAVGLALAAAGFAGESLLSFKINCWVLVLHLCNDKNTHRHAPLLNPTGRFAMRAMKQMEPQMKQAIQSFPKTVQTRFSVVLLISKVMS